MRFRKLQTHEFVCNTWFERDRQNIRLETPNGRTIFDLWDDDVTDAINAGLLPIPHTPRASDADWQPCAVKYAQNIGILD